MKTINYFGDSRYEQVWEQMQLLGIQDVSTRRQARNGTIVWRLPILSDRAGRYIEYASFASGYVRNQGVDCSSNWQINKCKMGKRYYKYPNGKTYTFDTKERILIPIEIDRLEYMIKYIIKNEYIKRANTVQQGNFIPKWKHQDLLGAMEAQCEDCEVKSVQVIIDGHRYKVI